MVNIDLATTTFVKEQPLISWLINKMNEVRVRIRVRVRSRK